jgi:hypothetical protein
MTIFRWFMRNGAVILFTVSLLIFVISVAGQFALRDNSFGSYSSDPGQASARLWFLLAAVGNALSSSALTFFAACLLYRLDRHWGGGKGPGA